MHSDEIIDAVGGMSRFQILLIFVILGPRAVISWGMLMMSFAGVPPKHWWCADDAGASYYGILNQTHSKMCPTGNNTTTCTFVYSQEKNTAINQWNLVCENKGLKPLIISIQMGGVLVGCLLAGHSSDAMGRKKTYMFSLLLHAGFNLVAAFSTSWQMFTALRFCIGSMVGAVLTVCNPYFTEFVGKKWRPITTIIPWWSVGSSILALSCWLLPNWSDQHIILAAMHIPFFLGWIVVPESLRWLAVHGHLKEAEKVVDQMARYNGTEKPANTVDILKKLAEEEQQKDKESAKKYTYIDIYRGWNICWKSLIIQFIWMSLSFVYYGINFGVGRLSGNLYFNMFLMAVVTVPGASCVYFLTNCIGRRWTNAFFLTTATCAAFGVVIVSRFGTETSQLGTAITTLALVCRMGVGSAWAGTSVVTIETYPTPIRNLGFGAANTAARVGAIISPYVFIVGGDDLLPPFVIVGSILAGCTCLCLVLRETKGIPLEDTTKSVTSSKPEEVSQKCEEENPPQP